MVLAVVLLNTDLGAQEEVVDNLRRIDGVQEAHALYGVYDLFVRIKAKDLDDLRNMTKSRIKQVAGVTSSLTLVLNDGLKEISPNPQA